MLTPYTSSSSMKLKSTWIYTISNLHIESHMHLVGQLTTTKPPTKPKSKKENSMQGIYLIKKPIFIKQESNSPTNKNCHE